MQRITHLLLDHDVVSLVVHHVVYRNLTLSSALLRRHWHVVRLVHRVLVALSCLRFPSVLRLLVGILHYFVHLNFVANRWRRLGVLDVVHVLIHYLGLHVLVVGCAHLVVVDVVLASTRCSTAWI